MEIPESLLGDKMIEPWILDNWEGIMIRIENEAFTGLSYSVPG